ncbi:MAG: hypothetical protein ABIP65_06645 [Vicinamibacterales bacterium]
MIASAEAPRTASAVVARREGQDFDLAILDLNYTRDTTSGREGLDLMQRIRALGEAMRRGARDYIEKPWDDERLLVTVARDRLPA